MAKVVLVTFRRGGGRRDCPLPSPVTVIGRRADCELRIPSDDVSRAHCRLELMNGTVKLRDLGSSNGTYVNSRRVVEAELKPGDRLTVGPVTFTVQIDGEPAQIAPPRAKPARPRAAAPPAEPSAAAEPAEAPPAAPAEAANPAAPSEGGSLDDELAGLDLESGGLDTEGIEGSGFAALLDQESDDDLPTG